MRFDVLTLHPELVRSPLEHSILGRARESGLIEVKVANASGEGLWAQMGVEISSIGVVLLGGVVYLVGRLEQSRGLAVDQANNAREEALADLWATGVAPDGHPTKFVRPHLDKFGVCTAADLRAIDDGSKVLVAGVVTHRQRPATAGGTTFINLEDETGLINVVCSRGCWVHHRQVARTATAMLVRGRLENVEGVINIVAERLEPLPLAAPASRDFR